MARDATVTRERLMRAGEQLFALHGVDRVRVRDINQLAGQRNSSALHYHFGSRDGLVQAILDQHRGPIEEQRIALIDAVEREGRTHDLRAIVETIVVPLASELATESGRNYLQILPEVVSRMGLPVGKIPDRFGPRGIRRSLRLAHGALSELPAVLREERLAVGMEFTTYAIARRAHEIDVDTRFRLPEEAFIANVVDMAVGMLAAPVGRLTTERHPR